MIINENDKHYGEYIKLTEQSDFQLLRSIRSYEKNLYEHKDKILNPNKYIDDWLELPNDNKNGTILYWEKEIESFKIKLELAKTVANERGL